ELGMRLEQGVPLPSVVGVQDRAPRKRPPGEYELVHLVMQLRVVHHEEREGGAHATTSSITALSSCGFHGFRTSAAMPSAVTSRTRSDPSGSAVVTMTGVRGKEVCSCSSR